MAKIIEEPIKLKFHSDGFEYAKELISQGKINCDIHSWPLDQPTPIEEETYVTGHDLKDYGKWFLAINEGTAAEIRGHYELPLGNFKEIYRSGVVAAKARAEQFNYHDIEKAADELLQLIDKQVCKASS